MTDPVDPVDRVDPVALVAAGMLQAAGAVEPGLTGEEAATRFAGLLDPSTRWIRVNEGVDPTVATDPPPAAGWTTPDPAVAERFGPALRDAWVAAFPNPQWYRPVLRLTVTDHVALARLAALHEIDGVLVAPLLARSAPRFFWRWPLRVGVLDGPEAAAWRDAMAASSSYSGTLYDVTIVGPGDSDLEILVVDDRLDENAEGSARAPARTACVIAAGDDRPTEALLARASAGLDPALAAAVPAAGVNWFGRFVEELSHDLPLDAALARTAPGALVAGDPRLVQLTAVGRWAAAVGAEAGGPAAADPGAVTARGEEAATPAGVAATLTEYARHGNFTSEAETASAIVVETRALIGTPGELVVERAMAMAAPPPASAGEPGPEPSPGGPTRRLLADITSGGELCPRALAPHTDHQLEVQIAVPDAPTEGVAFDEHAVPTGSGVARLDVVVTCADVGLHARESIDLPTADRTQPSTVAAFAFRTGDDASSLDFEVLVLHQKRPIAKARVLATVRATPARRDRVQILPVPLTSLPEPDPEATPADVSWDGSRGTLRNVETGTEVPIDGGAVRALLDDIEQRASRVLAADEAVTWQPGERAPSLLVELARLGSQLHRKLADIDELGARSVSLMVRYDTPIIPVELAYAGPAPARTAKLCAHATQPPDAADEPCPKASARVVCPQSFWGMHRTIIRTIERPTRRGGLSARGRRPGRDVELAPMGPLHLRPVLYAAADLADGDLPAGTPRDHYPSHLLQAALHESLATEVTRVTNWRAWRKQVRTGRPELLVVLAHTETIDGESTLLIGRQSVLAQPDVTAALVAGEGSPRPLVVLLACASGVAGDDFFGALPASFTASGAAAVVATLSKLKGPDGARAAAAVVAALHGPVTSDGTRLGAALTAARRTLVAAGLLVGLVLVCHGEIDVELTGG